MYDDRHSVQALRAVFASLLTAALTLGLGPAGPTADAAQAGTGRVRIEVADAGTPVAGALVAAANASAATDASGVVTLSLASGTASIVATKDGYRPATSRVDVAAGAERTVRLAMVQATVDTGTVVASTRTGRRVEDQATPVALIQREQIEARMLKSPGDIVPVFDQIPGVRAQITSPVLGTTSLRIRGLPGHYTRLLSDGVPQHFDRPGGHALLRIPPLDLGHVEVIKDPASALFGSDAGGSVNLLSRRPASEPRREVLFSQSSRGATDALLWLSSPPAGSWSSTFLFSGHRQQETDVDDDGWSDIPGYERAVVHPRVFWDNKQGKSVAGTANVTFETREGGSAIARESLETRTADGSLSGQMMLGDDYILAGAAVLFVQSRTRDFSDLREGDRLQTATIEITLRRPTARHTWLAGIASDWYALRSGGALASTYVSTRPGIFVHDDFNVAPWLVVSGSARLDEHNLYGLLVSPRGSALLRRGPWAARVSASQGYFTPRLLMDETEAAGVSRVTIDGELEVETARSFSADFMHTTRATAVVVTLFRTQIDDPAQIDRDTYTLRTRADPIVTRGVEFQGTVRRAPFSVTAAYTFVRTRERGTRELALTPQHSAGLTAGASGTRGRIGIEVLFTGEQRLDRNPYRSTSEPYVVAGFVGEYRLGRWGLFVNADNLTDVRQTDWDPIVLPLRDVDGRSTVDAWAPLKGRVINGGLRISF